jgi:Lysylphosphatidylglycerol synthase TM region
MQTGDKKGVLSKSRLAALYKISVLLLMLGILYVEFGIKKNPREVWTVFLNQLSTAPPIFFAAVVALMPLNWYLEMLKWRPLLARYEDLSAWRAFQAVIAGISVSLFTPNRVGEFGGRMLFVRRANQWKSAVINWVGNFCQFMILLTGGTAGLLWFMERFLDPDPWIARVFVWVALLSLSLLYLIFFNIRFLLPAARRIPVLQKLRPYLRDVQILADFRRRELLLILALSALRYGVYSTQYLLLLYFFGINTGILEGYGGIAAIFLMQSTLPLPPVAGLLARGNLAVYVWSFFGGNEAGSLAATFILWIINLILPSLFGTFFLLNVNISKTLGYEND